MATKEYVYHGSNVLHVPAVIDPQGDPEKTTPGAMFAPGIPTTLDDRDAQRPTVKHLIDTEVLKPASDADKARAAEIEDERKRENAERERQEGTSRGAHAAQPGKK